MANYELKNESGIKDFTPSGTQLYAGDTITNTYSGSQKGIKLPPGIYLFECWGAQGGTPYRSSSLGGNGGYIKGTLAIREESNLFLISGGAGKQGTSSSTATVSGGFNGGGESVGGGASGGGASDVCLNSTSLTARILVAGGGGGGSAYGTTQTASGGIGGNTTGGNGAVNGSGTAASGGTQSAGGTGARTSYLRGDNGDIGDGGSATTSGPISGNSGGPGGGGGGYYGGGGGIIDISSSYVIASGAGGSSYVSSDFEDVDMQAGTRSGNGHIIITVISPTLGFAAYYKTSNEWKQLSKAFVKVSGSWKNISKMYYKYNGSWHLIGGTSPGPTPTSAELHVYAPGATAIWAMNGSTRADGVQDTEATGYWNIPVSIGTWNVNGTKAGQSAAALSVNVTEEMIYEIDSLCYASTPLNGTYWVFNENAYDNTYTSVWNDAVAAYCDIEFYDMKNQAYATYSNDSTHTVALLNPLLYGNFTISSIQSMAAVIKKEEKYTTTGLPSYVYYMPVYTSSLFYKHWGAQYDIAPSSYTSTTEGNKSLGLHIVGNVLFESDWTKINNYYTFLQNNATKYTTASAWKTAVNAL